MDDELWMMKIFRPVSCCHGRMAYYVQDDPVGSLVTGHWSLVTGHWSLVTGYRLPITD